MVVGVPPVPTTNPFRVLTVTLGKFVLIVILPVFLLVDSPGPTSTNCTPVLKAVLYKSVKLFCTF